MIDTELKLIISKIKSANAEFQNIEVKRAENGVPEKLYDTLSSFSNQNDGGIIIFGLYENNNFEVTGVNDVQNLQKKVMEQCNQMSPAVRAVFTVTEEDGKNVVAAEIPPVEISERPCFYQPKGRIKGSYVRVGDADIPMTEYEVYSYEAYRKKYQDDIRIIDRSDISSLNINKLDSYLFKLKEQKPNLSMIEDEQIKSLMSIIKDGKPTLFSQMLFGIYPQAFMPQLSIIATAVQGTEIGENGSDGSRFTDSKRIEGTIPEMLESAISFVRTNTKVKTIIDSNGKRHDIPDYPMNAVREVILNSLVHRDYSIHTEGMPVQLMIFSDRLEVRNPGGLYGRLTVDTLGNAQPDTRNPSLATAMELLGLTENRYSGIPTIRREMLNNNHPEPEFSSIHGEFRVCLRNTECESDNKQDSLLEFCRTPKSKKEIADFLKISSVSYAIKTYISPLAEKGLISLSNPSSPGSPNQKYYTTA